MSDEDPRFWIYAGGLPYELTEGDVICIFSQYGEVIEFVLARDKDTGRSRGFGFLRYENPKSCELAVDNFNGTTIVGRRIKVSFAHKMDTIRGLRPANVAPADNSTMPVVESAPERRRLANRRYSPASSPLGRDRHVGREHDRSYDRNRSYRRDNQDDDRQERYRKEDYHDKHYDHQYRTARDESPRFKKPEREFDRGHQDRKDRRRSRSHSPDLRQKSSHRNRSHHTDTERSKYNSSDIDKDRVHSRRHKISSRSHRSRSRSSEERRPRSHHRSERPHKRRSS